METTQLLRGTVGTNIAPTTLEKSLHPEEASISHSSSRPCTLRGRKISWRQFVPVLGIAFDVTAITLTCCKVTSIWGVVAVASSSLIIHGISSVALYIWQPQHELPLAVQEAPAIARQDSPRESSLREENGRLQAALKEQAEKLLLLQESSKQQAQVCQDKEREIKALSSAMASIRKELEDAQSIAKIWKSHMESFNTLFSNLLPGSMEEAGSVETQIRELIMSLNSQEMQFKESSLPPERVEEVRQCLFVILTQTYKAFQKISSDLIAKNALLLAATGEIEKLRKGEEDLQIARRSIQQLQKANESLSEGLHKTTDQLEKILKIPEIVSILGKLTRATKP